MIGICLIIWTYFHSRTIIDSNPNPNPDTSLSDQHVVTILSHLNNLTCLPIDLVKGKDKGLND